MKGKIRNLELVLRDKMKFTVTESESPYSVLGTQEVRYYDSELGKVKVYKLIDKRGNSEEFLQPNKEKLDSRMKDFYGQRVKTAVIFSPEQVMKLTEI